MAPGYEELAKENPGVIFVKIDVEASPANQALCGEAGIRVFPTLQLYKSSQRVDEVCRGVENIFTTCY